MPNARFQSVIKDGAEVDDAEKVVEHRDKDNVGETDGLLDDVVLGRMSVENEEVKVLIGELRSEASSDIQSREEML